MATEIGKELAALGRMTPAQLREKYAAVFGEATVTRNRTWLIRRIAWRLQVLAEGDLSQRARERAAELARDADLRVIPPRAKPAAVGCSQDVILGHEWDTRGTRSQNGRVGHFRRSDRRNPRNHSTCCVRK